MIEQVKPYQLLYFNTNESNSSQWSELPYVTPQMYGAKGDGVTDDSAAFQLALNNEINKPVYVPHGQYLLMQDLHMWQNNSNFYCDGTLIVHNCKALKITSSRNNVYIKKIDSTTENQGIGIYIGASASAFPYYNNIDVDHIINLEKGILFEPDAGGIAYTVIHFKEIIATYGIRFEPTENTGSFINENIFYGGAITSPNPISTVKNGATDPYNGNKFYNIALEFCSGGMNFEWFQYNRFLNCRFSKWENNWGDNFVTFNDTATDNYFNFAIAFSNQIHQPESCINIFDGQLKFDNGTDNGLAIGRAGVQIGSTTVIRQDNKYDVYDLINAEKVELIDEIPTIDLSNLTYAIEGHTYRLEGLTENTIFKLPQGYWYGKALYLYVHIIDEVQVTLYHEEDSLVTLEGSGLYKIECNPSRSWFATKID